MPSLTYENGVFVWHGPYEEREQPKSAKFEWNLAKKRWETRDMFTAARLGLPCKELQSVLTNIERSLAKTPSYLEPDGLYPYQAAGVECMSEQFALGRANMLLADQPGLGKTPQTARLADVMGWKNLLVICPASLRLNWVREIERWRKAGSEPVAVLDSKRFPKPGCTVVVSYDIFVRPHWADVLSLYPFDALVCDESHYLKNIDAKRTKAILGKEGLYKQIRNTLLLSGTPIPNRAHELFKIVKLFAKEAFPWSYWDFCGRYHQYVLDGKPRGSRNEDDLYTRLRGSGFMLRRRKEDVLKDLPPKTHQLVVFPADGSTRKVLQREREFSAQEIIQHGVPVGTSLPEVRREMGIAKAPVCASYVAGLLDGGLEKVVCAAHHTDVIARIAHDLREYGVVVVQGDTRPRKRQEAVDRFQTDPQVRVFVGQLTAAGTGITLTAASDVVFVEASWVPGENEQMLDRCHRIGQVSPVLAHYLVVEGSLDAKILGTAAGKAEGIAKIMDGNN